ncbi:MAG: hydrogenase iron-sulfur subunit [Desulfotomaculales bacterium]
MTWRGAPACITPPTVDVISLPCTSGIRPEWILFAVEKGFDGVFIAADGEECPYLPDCTSRAAEIFQRAQDLLAKRGYAPARVRMAAICSVCAGPFVEQIGDFAETEISADLAVVAVGLYPLTETFRKTLELNGDGTVKVDPETLQTSVPYVFAGGTWSRDLRPSPAPPGMGRGPPFSSTAS